MHILHTLLANYAPTGLLVLACLVFAVWIIGSACKAFAQEQDKRDEDKWR